MTDPGQPNLKEDWQTGDTVGSGDWNALAGRINDVEDANADDDEAIAALQAETFGKRITAIAYTGGVSTVRYFEVARLPIDRSDNSASLVLRGRLGGWTPSAAMAEWSIALANRTADYNGLTITSSVLVQGAVQFVNADLEVYSQADKSAIVYLKATSYYAIDMRGTANGYNPASSATVNFVTTPTTPVGTKIWALSTAPRAEVDMLGRVSVATPIAAAHATTKAYVDSSDATKLNSDRGRALNVSGSNLMFDPRFEIPAIWAGNSRLTISTEQKIASFRSLKYVAAEVTDFTFDLTRAANGSGGGDSIYVTEGDTYQLSMWYYIPAALSGTGFANAYVRAQDSTGVNANIFSNTNQITFATATVGAWQKASVQFTVPAGYDRIGVVGRYRDVPVGGVVYLGNPILRDVTNDTKQTRVAVPASATAAGVAGTIASDANYLYVCTATNTWKRIALAAW